MKSFISQAIITLCCVGILSFANPALAYHGHGGGGWHHGGGWGGRGWGYGGALLGGAIIGATLASPYYYGGGDGYYDDYRECGWVHAHYNRYGDWIPGHRVCW